MNYQSFAIPTPDWQVVCNLLLLLSLLLLKYENIRKTGGKGEKIASLFFVYICVCQDI